MKLGYEETIRNLGNKTTKINYKRNEADFADYGNKLSSNLKEKITNSFDKEQDNILQSEIAELYRKGNISYAKKNALVNALNTLGYKVTVDSNNKTTYIPDNKANVENYLKNNKITSIKVPKEYEESIFKKKDAPFNKEVTFEGKIDIYTISDEKGGEFTIADSNNNGAVEIEELFMNKILENTAEYEKELDKLEAAKNW